MISLEFIPVIIDKSEDFVLLKRGNHDKVELLRFVFEGGEPLREVKNWVKREVKIDVVPQKMVGFCHFAHWGSYALFVLCRFQKEAAEVSSDGYCFVKHDDLSEVNAHDALVDVIKASLGAHFGAHDAFYRSF